MTSHKEHKMQDTSLKAHDEMLEKLGKRQIIVLQALRELCEIFGDATDQEIKSHLMVHEPNYVRPRRFELVNDFKLVGFNQKRMCRVTKKNSNGLESLR